MQGPKKNYTQIFPVKFLAKNITLGTGHKVEGGWAMKMWGWGWVTSFEHLKKGWVVLNYSHITTNV